MVASYVAIRFSDSSFRWERGVISNNLRMAASIFANPRAVITVTNSSQSGNLFSISVLNTVGGWVYSVNLPSGNIDFWWKIRRANE